VIISNCRCIVGGIGEGIVLRTTQPLNFLAMVNPKDGIITDKSHELYGKSLKGSVLVLPYAIGSSVGAYAFHSLKEYGKAPSAVVCSKVDITTASGCALANIPVVNLPVGSFMSILKEGLKVRVDADAGTIVASFQ
jgi:predicted aconitase with swiveling domain